ncbi:hypothetical protein FSP39_017174 [Pinctada imbricata]|uniref:Uncharacterized protein n=1 Tax=Pinctada imbricata TaxID=66713 RepID=A0AA88YRQ5_PINIB|nr:hypothetical protein FSP39_017174 [Pinctada imbricata]
MQSGDADSPRAPGLTSEWMLRAVTIQNFIPFHQRQRLKLEDGANFIIGANGTEADKSLSQRLGDFITSLESEQEEQAFDEKLQSIAEALREAYNQNENVEYSSETVPHSSKDHENDFGAENSPRDKEVKNRCEEVLKILTERVVTLFGKRSVDPSMWDKSSQRRSAHATGDYFTSRHEKAEIFVELLSKRNQDYIDRDQEQMFFNALIFPQRYEFELDEKTMECTAINKNTDLKTSLVKTSEGIIEAKQLSLILSSSKYDTILIQNPEKGMHPPMIEKLRDLVLRRIRNKVVVVSSHNQNLIASWSLPRTFMCRFHYIQPGHYENTVVPCKSLPQNALAGDELKKIPFSAHVLFVEGPSDKKMIRSVLYLIQEKITSNQECEILDGIEDKESFCNFISLLTIVSQDGAKNHLNLQRTCDILGISYTFIYDTDVFISKAKQVIRKCLPSYISNVGDRNQAELLDFTGKEGRISSHPCQKSYFHVDMREY